MANERLPVPERAGTRLDWEHTDKIYGLVNGRKMEIGALDRKQGVFQGGGELSNFVMWRYRKASIPWDTWEYVKDKAEWFELVDHERNRCYRISIELANRIGEVYDAGIGPRWGIPLDYFRVIGGPKKPRTGRRSKKRPPEPPRNTESLF